MMAFSGVGLALSITAAVSLNNSEHMRELVSAWLGFGCGLAVSLFVAFWVARLANRGADLTGRASRQMQIGRSTLE